MKAILFSSLLLASNCFAANFAQDSLVPKELQTAIVAAVYSTYPCLNELKEERTEISTQVIDQFVDLYFTTSLRASYHFDGLNPVDANLVVKSAKYDFSNGQNLEVLEIQAEGGQINCPSL